mmetsp:Transcript_4053/g.7813  ORF Transcript_4053/g.7813 Transcript_4053/m.7813 type:complete len:2001 (-) Transcript_4053:99-6101(-)|eukprot:CAMPEP_0175163134 /NCGR_PEP_ID=MMETSP0087-20121206/25562_1 /TAXON_ID=136419 /ORGANISM="Unknown Unknown, Strain D1" /LENGTH=2000 /DNA_ID=CAMNT_0016451767 /DNA_START=43 /DNA_END=6042 /DNA_ORIENTATION=+
MEPGEDCQAQYIDGLFYSAKISRVLENSDGLSYSVCFEEFGEQSGLNDRQVRANDYMGKYVTSKITEFQCVGLMKDELKSVDPDVLEYAVSIAVELCNKHKNLDVESWAFRLTPVLDETLSQDQIRTVCERVINKAADIVAKERADGGRKSSTKDANLLVSVPHLTLGYMGKILLVRTCLELQRGHKYGIVGENGAGKTTLMRKIANGSLPGFPRWIRTEYVQPDFDTMAEYETALEYLTRAQKEANEGKQDLEEINRLLNELSFTDKLKNTLIKELSGGWKMRVSLASASMVKADLLLLDEPTNHLDVTAVAWLENYLRNVQSTVMVISHEPSFLDKVTTDILYMKGQKLNPYEGNFSDFLQQQADFSKEDLESSAIGTADSLNFRFPDPGLLAGVKSRSRAVLMAKDVRFAYDAKKGDVLKGVSAKLTLSSRVAVVGPNGAGKSTLVKLLVGENKQNTGSVWRHHNLRIAYVAQHSFDHLESTKDKPAMAYIRQRFIRGYDKESAAYKGTDENENFDKSASAEGQKGGKIETLLGTRKFKNTVAYEVKWEGLPDNENTWMTEMRLKELGYGHLVAQCMEQIRSKKSGLDQRPLTNKEITRHLGDFGLDKNYANARIEGLSGGQKCKLVLAGALWVKPHFLILDEPTNYLDLEALAALSKAINKYKGGIIMVSHNKEFIETICDQQWNMKDGVIESIKEVQRTGVEGEASEGFEHKSSAVDKASAAILDPVLADADMAKVSHSVAVLLGEKGLFSKVKEVKEEAADSLIARVPSFDFKTVLMVTKVVLRAMKESNDIVWAKFLTLATVLCKRGQTKETEELLDLLQYMEDHGGSTPSTPITGPMSPHTGPMSPLGGMRAAPLSPKFAPLGGRQGSPVKEPLFRVGETVEAVYSEDGLWYKAQVKRVQPRNMGIDIVFTEYNEEASVKVSEVRKIEAAQEKAQKSSPTTSAPSVNAGMARLSLNSNSDEISGSVRASMARFIVKGACVACLPANTDAEKARIKAVAEGLIFSLTTASPGVSLASYSSSASGSYAETVRKGISTALCELVAKISSLFDPASLLQSVLSAVLEAPSHAVRANAAACFAAVSRALRVNSLRKHGFLATLKTMMAESSDVKSRVAALAIYPALFKELKSAFEHNVKTFLPLLLTAFQDKKNSTVAAAAADASKALMGALSLHGAKMAMPLLLQGLEKKNWKEVADCVSVLAMITGASPDLMAANLPVIVPKLLQVMSNPRRELQDVAATALSKIGSIIENPEIKPLVPDILQALQDSFNMTQPTLTKLTRTSFAYAIDSASLALLMPVVFQGMRDRKADTKKAAMKVVSALCALIVDIRALEPYAAELLDKLKSFLTGNTPDLRTLSAKALGTVYREMGEDQFPDLMPWLLRTLGGTGSNGKGAASAHEISGAAQGFCYCSYALGVEQTQKLLPQVTQQTKSKEAAVRVGAFDVFTEMPEVFGVAFSRFFLQDALPAVLQGVSDSVMTVSEAAMQASQILVSKYTRQKLDFILPLVMNGLAASDPRTRTRFLQLLGTIFLNLVVDVNFGQAVRFWGHGNSLAEDEIANEATAEQEELLANVLGIQRRDDIFSKLYLLRGDESEGVGSMAFRVWHLVVPNERNLLDTMLEGLLEKIITMMQSSSETEAAEDETPDKVLGRKGFAQLVVVMGDAGLARLVPMLVIHSQTQDSSRKSAILTCFREILKNARKEDVGAYLNDMIPLIAAYLRDGDKGVRGTAGVVFAQLYKNVGAKAIERIVPILIEGLRNKNKEVDSSLNDGVLVVLSKCEGLPYFALCVRFLSVLPPADASQPEDQGPLDELRTAIVNQLCELTAKDSTNHTRASKILQWLCETQNQYMQRHRSRFCKELVKRYMDTFAAVRTSAQQGLLHAFDYQTDREAGETALGDFCKNSNLSEFLPDLLKALHDVTLVHVTEEVMKMGEKSLPESESKAEDSEAAEAQEQPVQEKLARDEKRCAKCKLVLKKTKFAQKQFKSPTGKCKKCSM